MISDARILASRFFRPADFPIRAPIPCLGETPASDSLGPILGQTLTPIKAAPFVI
jgi:hypothetical protein